MRVFQLLRRQRCYAGCKGFHMFCQGDAWFVLFAAVRTVRGRTPVLFAASLLLSFGSNSSPSYFPPWDLKNRLIGVLCWH